MTRLRPIHIVQVVIGIAVGWSIGIEVFRTSEPLQSGSLPCDYYTGSSVSRSQQNHLGGDRKKPGDKPAEPDRLFCAVSTSVHRHKSYAYHINSTWGKRCHKLVFFSNESDSNLLPVVMNTSSVKAMHIAAVLDYIIGAYISDYDWFLAVDDMSYVIIENLLDLVANYSRVEPIYFGHQFKTNESRMYLTLDSGIILSREALFRFGKRSRYCMNGSDIESMALGHCMDMLQVRMLDSRDHQGRTRFHCYSAAHHLQGIYPEWYHHQDAHGATQGMEHMSDYPISFNLISPENVLDTYEYLLYHLRVFSTLFVSI